MGLRPRVGFVRAHKANMNEFLHWLPAILPTLIFAAGWGSTRSDLARVREDLREVRAENKELAKDLHAARTEIAGLRTTVTVLHDRSEREPTGPHPTSRR